MYYYKTTRDSEGLWLVEEKYDWNYSKKSESVFTIANGYVGIRGAQDFCGISESRGMFINGFFQKATPNEVTELINCPDITLVEIISDGEMISFDCAEIENYERKFNVETAELRCKAVLKQKNGNRIQVCSSRFVSFADKHLYCQTLQVTPLDRDINNLKIKLGINGQITNSGAGHIRQTQCRVYDNRYLRFTGMTDHSSIEIAEAIDIEMSEMISESFGLERRSIYKKVSGKLSKGETLVIEKKASIFKSNDKDFPRNLENDNAFCEISKKANMQLFKEHCEAAKDFWKYADLEIEGISLEDKAAVKYAQIQLFGMTPSDKGESSIGAKGLSGEGYKGHVFWDTEMYMLPFYIYTFPERARDLLLYRYRGLEGAREKARDYGYQGAMYPWESALDGREETPLFAALNIHTGKANPVWSGRKEHHVSADIGYAIIHYYQATKDWEFIEKYGLEMLIGISEFWVSRAEERDGKLVILDCIGPDEYDEHIDNNAFTNYMAKYVVETTLSYIRKIREEKFESNLNLIYSKCDQYIEKFRDFCERIYLPKPREDMLIPQDDTFLEKPELPDIEVFRNAPEKQSVLLKYSRDEVVGMQTLKQADVVMLLNTFPFMFEKDVVKKNVEYYEARTLHDSSLSYCAHAQACASIGDLELSSVFFRRALEIDLCDNPMDSRDGLHAASLGGIWNCIVMGYAGLSISEKELKITPHLPQGWKSISFTVCYQGQYYRIKASAEATEMNPIEI